MKSVRIISGKRFTFITSKNFLILEGKVSRYFLYLVRRINQVFGGITLVIEKEDVAALQLRFSSCKR